MGDNTFNIIMLLFIISFGGLFAFLMMRRSKQLRVSENIIIRNHFSAISDFINTTDDCIYSVGHDFSLKIGGLIFKNFDDQELGNLAAGLPDIDGHLNEIIAIGDEFFELDSVYQGVFRRPAISLYKDKDRSYPLCTRKHVGRSALRFEFPDGNALTCELATPDGGLIDMFTKSYTRYANIKRESETIGIIRTIGGFNELARIMVLPRSVPLEIRMFILAKS